MNVNTILYCINYKILIGWVRTIVSDNLYQIESISHEIFCNRAFTPYKEAFRWFKFADGTPFGIKEN